MIKLLKGNCLDLLRQPSDQYFDTATKRIQEAEDKFLNDF